MLIVFGMSLYCYKAAFDSSSAFFIPPFQYLLNVGSVFFFKVPIHCIEVFAYGNCYSLYHIHYLCSLQLALFLLLGLLAFLVLS